MKFVNEKSTEAFKVRESDNYEVVWDSKYNFGGLIVNGVCFTTLTYDQYKTLEATFKEKSFEDFFNSVGIGDKNLNLQPKAACKDDYERPTGDVIFETDCSDCKKGVDKMSKSYNAKVRAVESTLNEGIKPVTVYYTNGDVEKFASLRAFCLHEELVSPKADYYGEFDSFYNGSYPSSVEDWVAVIRDNYGCTEKDISYITLFDKVVVDYRDDLNEAKTKSEKVPEAKIQESIDDPLSSRTFRLSPEQVDEFDTLEIIKEKFDDRCCCIEDVTDQSRYTEGMAELMDFYVQGTGTPEIEAIYWEVRTGNSFTWKIEVNLLDEDGESLYEDILSFIEDSIEGTSINESKKKVTEAVESRNGMTVAQFYDKVSEVKDYLSNDTPLFAKFGDSTWCINSAYANRRELILTDSQGFTCDLARLYELKKNNELGQKKAVYFIADGGGGVFRIDSVKIKSGDRGNNKTLVLELLKDFSFESEEPVDDDVGTVDVHYTYSDGDVDDDTGYIVQWEDDYYEVQSDLLWAQGKTLEEVKANFEKAVRDNIDYDVEDVSFDWNIEEGLDESKKKLTEYESREYPVFVQINTDKDIDKWMAPVGCDIRPDYDISDVEGSYWEIIADDEDLYRKAIAEGAVTMSELDPETDTFIFLFGNPSRLSIEGFDGYISEMGLDPEDYGVDRCDYYSDNDDAEIQLDEKKLKEAQGTEQWAANRTKFKKFGSSYFDRLYMEYSFKRDELEEETPEYDAYNSVLTLIKLASDYLNTNHEAWRSSKKRQRFELYQFVNAPVEYFGLDCNNDHNGFSDEFFQACYEEGTIPFIKKYVKESELVEAINYIVNEVLNKRIGSEEHLVNKYADQQHKERAELEAKWSAQSAKFDEDTKFLQDAAKTAKVVIDVIESYSGPDDWSVILDTEDDYEANAFRNAVGDLLEGTENAYGASYDDIPGMGDIHLGCIQYYEWSEMHGEDVYDDLDEDIREKYVVFACPKKKWIDYRRRTDW